MKELKSAGGCKRKSVLWTLPIFKGKIESGLIYNLRERGVEGELFTQLIYEDI